MIGAELRVTGSEAIGPYTLLRLGAGSIDPGTPGQFFMLQPPGHVLPRPMSLCLWQAGELGFLIDPIGPGTRTLCRLVAGDRLHVLGPLGNGFDLTVPHPLIVGGGIGVAPFPYVSQVLGGPPAILGFRTPHHAEAAALVPGAEVVVEPTYVTSLLPSEPVDVLACGPEPMLEAVRALAPHAQLAWEAPMACGYGACYGCVVEVDDRLQRLCIAGPVRPPSRVTVPILNASGCLDALTAPEVALALDAFVTKTITPLPREGNQPVRIAETDAGMLNSIGLQGPGIDGLVEQTLPALSRLGLRVWVSVGGFSVGDYAGICERLDDRADVEAIELNLSCPNVEEAPETSAQIVAGCRSRTSKPLYAKLSPATWDIAESAKAVVAAGADGLSLVNTIRGMALDPVSLRPKLGRGTGGYSGLALKPIALACVSACARAVDVPIVGMGGVGSGLDALELVAAGAGVVSLGTILFADPAAPARVRRELDVEATVRGFANPLEARGVANG